MARQPKPAPAPAFTPYAVRDPYSMVGNTWMVLGRTFCGLRAVGLQRAYNPTAQVGVVDRVIMDWHARNYMPIDEDSPLQSSILDLKAEMLAHGATPNAVQWVGDLSPFTEEELITMASKLKTKTEAAPAPKAEKAPKAPKAAGGKKGNPEALEKAREARAGRSVENDGKKIKVLKKDNPYREGSARAASFEALKGAKTVADYKDAGGAAKYVTRWVDEGIIELA